MAHTYSSLLVHYVFSTKGRRELIPDFMQSRLWAYMGGIARSNRCKALGVGGTADHIHMLVLIPPAIAVASLGSGRVTSHRLMSGFGPSSR